MTVVEMVGVDELTAEIMALAERHGLSVYDIDHVSMGRPLLRVFVERAGAAGLDLCADVPEEVVIQPGEIRSVPTGISVSIPRGYEGQVRPRSGLALKHGITLVNTPGTIDSDYRGVICLIIINLGKEA